MGTQTVIATDRPVRDEDAAELALIFYRHGGRDQPAEALRRTAIEAASRGLSSWQNYRVIGLR